MLFTGCSAAGAGSLEHEASAMETGLMAATQYCVSEGGLLVPVTRQIPFSVDYAESSLGLLVSSPENDELLAKLRLTAPLPAGVTLSYRESGGLAEVNLDGLPAFADRDAEQRAVDAVAATVLSLPGVAALNLRFEGQVCQSLRHGTAVGGRIESVPVNAEPLPVSASGAALCALTLHYPLAEGGLLAPVTRFLSGEATAVRAVEELMRGAEGSELINPFPADASLISILPEDRRLTLDFTLPLAEISADEDRQNAVLRALAQTLTPYADFDTLYLTLEGAPFCSFRGSANNEIH